MKKVISFILCLIVTSAVFTSCGQATEIQKVVESTEEKALAVVKKYMTAMEQNDSTTMLECYDPTMQKTSEGLTNAVGNLLGIGDGYSLGAAAGGYIAGAVQDAMGISYELDFDKVLDQSFEKNKGHINVQYNLKVNYQGKSGEALIAVNFDMVKNKEDWYIKSVGESVFTSDIKYSGGEGPEGPGQQETAVEKAPIEYHEVRDFSDGVAWVENMLIWSCIDKTGKTLFTLNKYDKVFSDFSQGVAVVERGGTREMIDKTGKTISTPENGEYDRIESFIEDIGMIVVSKKVDTFEKTEEQMGIINNKGEWQVELSAELKNTIWNAIWNNQYMSNGIYDCSANRSEGVVFYSLFTNELIETGIKAYYDNPLYLSDGSGVFLSPNKDKVCSTNDKFETKEILDLVRPIFIGKYQEGLFYCYHEGEDVNGFFDIEGNKVIDLQQYTIYTEIKDIAFNDGYCLLTLKNPQGSLFYTVFDKTGKMMFEPRKGTGERNFSCGLAIVKMENTHAYINPSGEIIAEFEFLPMLFDFKEDVARVHTQLGEYYIDKTGKRLF